VTATELNPFGAGAAAASERPRGARSSEGRRVLRNTALLGAGNAVRLVLGLATTILTTDALGTDYGLLLGAQRYVDFFRNFAMYGLNSILVRGLAARREDPGVLFGSVLALRAALSVVFVAVTLVAASFSGYLPEHRWLLAVFVAVGLGLMAVETLTAYSEAYERMDRTATLPVTRALFMLIGSAGVYWLGGGLLGIALVYVVTQLAQIALSLGITRDLLRETPLRVSGARIASLLREGPHFMAVGLAYAALRSASVMILTRFSTKEEAAMFGAAINFIDVIFLVPLLAQRAFLPVMSREGRAASEVGRDGLQVFSSVLTPCAVGMALLCESAVALYPSGEFAAAASVLRVLAIGIAFSGLSSVCTTYLTGQGGVNAILWAYALALPVQLGCAYAWVGAHGAVGVAAATVAAQGVLCACNLFSVAKLGMAIPARALARHAVASAVMAAVVWPLRSLFVPIPALAGIAAYAAALLAVSPAGSLERVALAQLRRRFRSRAAGGKGAQ
jgi:O-antigen/teichoic acid export membrane protein